MSKIDRNTLKGSGACPAQWHGKTDDSREVYIRYRSGHFRVYINWNTDNEEMVVDDEIGNWLDGSMTYSEMLELLARNKL